MLYKYLTPERIDVIENKLIRYTQPDALNDPFELKPHASNLASDEYILSMFDETYHDEITQSYHELPKEIRDTISLNEFHEAIKPHVQSLRQHLPSIASGLNGLVNSKLHDGFNQHVGILSLTEAPDNLLMWSHYASEHTGFVIGFDETNKHFNSKRSESDEFYHLRKLEYRQHRPDISLIEMNSTDVFLVKSTDWEYESEWRIMRPLDHADKKIEQEDFSIHLFSIPADSIVEIIMGCRMDKDVMTKLLTTIATDPSLSHVRLYKSMPNKRQFKLDIHKIHQ